jgi:hemoglobin/transferrin/lactoferrin receptor protein
MKNALMLMTLLCFINIGHSQTIKIKVNDQISLQPISWVYLSFDLNSKPNSYSNDDGEISIELNELKKHDLFYFYHPHYKSQQLNLKQLEAMNYQVLLLENVNSLDEIVVSASKFNEKKSDVAQKIQVIRSSEINFMNQSSTADVMANTGNIMVQKSQLGGGSPIIRGFETNKVLLVIDGVRMNNAIYRGGHLQNILTLDNAILDRVEVVYGPGSTVYGSDALGGVMSFTTKDPTLSNDKNLLVKSSAYARYMSAVSGYAAHADVSVGTRSFGSLTSFTFSNFGDLRQGAHREPFVGNFGSRPWYVERVGDKDSMFVNADTNLQVGSGYSQYDFLQKFTFVPNNKIKHTFNFQLSNSSNVDRYDRLTLMNGSKPKFSEWFYGPQKRLMGSYSLNLSGSNLFYDNAKLILAYQQIEESRIDRRFNQVSRNKRIENLDILSLNIDLAKFKGNHEFRYGIEGWYNNVTSTAFSENITTGEISPLDTRYASGGASMKSIALYVTHTWELNDKFILNDGLRFSNVGLKASFTDTTFFKFPFTEANQNNSSLNGNLGLIYSPDSNFRITGLISTGFRAPNVDDLSKVFESTPGSLIIPNNNLKPENTYNTELGMSSIINSWLTLQATGYYSLYRNAITIGNAQFNGKDSIEYEGVMSKVVSAVNAKNAYLYGLELAMNASMNKNISIYGTFNYTYARIVTDSIAIPLDHIPPTFGKLGLQITEKGFKADMFIQYSGWKRIEDYNPFGEDNQAYALPEGMPSWYTVNLRVGYQFNKNINLQIACENILDRNYRVFASNISAPGRNFILTLRGNF